MLPKLVMFLSILLFIAGCGPKTPKKIQLPPQKTLDDSLSVINSKSKTILPMQMTGRCIWEHKNHTDKNKKEEFTVKIWLNPPYQIRLQGDIAFNAKGLMLGSNKNQFWLAIKPQIDSFWWGNWAQQSNYDNLIMSPAKILEAIGIVRIEDKTLWSLTRENSFDILTKRNADGKLEKKLYITGFDYRIAKIEYFDSNEQLMIAIYLEKYEQVNNAFFIPEIINTISYNNDRSTDSFKISIGSVQKKELSEAIFSLPPLRGYENIYQIIDANVVELK